MNRRHWIHAAIVLQLGVLATEYLGSVWPIWTGERVRLEIEPVDPRSMFRGNYARLGYTIASVDTSLFSGPSERLRKGEVVYVVLEQADESWRAARIQLSKPASGVFLRGRLRDGWSADDSSFRVRYGIEAWFAPREKAIAIEQSTRRQQGEGARAFAEIAVASSGRAALVELDLP
jgi:uncharacterized membrane-anchored protein